MEYELSSSSFEVSLLALGGLRNQTSYPLHVNETPSYSCEITRDCRNGYTIQK